ncbi:MAG: hypothetical protein ACJ75B_15395 [Flavisolibacter sp.]
MFGSKILEVAIGLIFIFILISIICSAIRESLEAWFKTRAAYLEYGIRELLNDRNSQKLAQSLYQHPVIYSLYWGDYKPSKNTKSLSLLASGCNLPSYIPSKNFAVALMDIVVRGPDTDAVSSDPASPIVSLQSLRLHVLNIQNEKVQRALLTAIDTAQGDLNTVQSNIEAWYDSAMDRVSGWYKRATQWILFWIGIVVAVALNVNVITIGDFLYRNDAVRTALVSRAQEAAKDSNFISEGYDKAKADLDAISLPIGWTDGWGAPRRESEQSSGGAWNRIFGPLLGWLLTALAAMMGAPFWFDVLNKVTVIRSTVKPHEKSGEEGSEDRAAAPQVPVINVQEKIGETKPVERSQKNFVAWNEIPSPTDNETMVDGCDAEPEQITSDQELPAAEGGVA